MIKAYVFDAYGTLFDVHSAVRLHAGRIGVIADRFSDVWRTKQLEYTWVLTLSGNYENFEVITAWALDFAMARHGLEDEALRADLLSAYNEVEAYSEVKGALLALKKSGAKLAILSNGTMRMLEAAIKHSELGDLFDFIFSVDTIKQYKTKMDAYEIASNGLRLRPEEISFQSSNRWDIAGATQFGFRTVWINRTKQPDEYPTLRPQFVLSNLADLVELD